MENENPPTQSDHQHSSAATPATAPDAILDRRVLLGAAGLAGLAAFASQRASAGPLTPPAGAIGSTGKTLTEIEPRIAVNATNTPPASAYMFILPGPGSYYLTGNINVPATGRGIFMNAGATLDLNGFTITGGGIASIGIDADNGCTIRNGSITNVATGVQLGGPAFAVLIEDVVITGFTFRGMNLATRAIVRRCSLTGAGGVGIELRGDYGRIEDCNVTNTGGTGIYVNSFSVVRGCLLSGCNVGVYAGYGSHVQRCEFSACTSAGLQASQRSVVSECVATNVTGIGIDLGDGAEAVGCTCNSCNFGIRASTAARIISCSADACTAAAIRITGAGSTVEACRLSRNAIAVDMTGTGGPNFVHKCVLLGNASSIAVNIGGNWYPTVALGGVNTATNPLASIIG